MTNSQLTMTIGAVSRATGIPVNTLRTWERRYSFPIAERSDGGQRLYPPNVVPHLNLINQALKSGMRPKQVVGIEFDDLQELLGKSLPPKPTERNEVQDWVDAAHRLDGAYLDSCFHSSVSQLGVQKFLTDKIAPFIHELGESWASGKIQIFHEHFASERIHDFLTTLWRPLSDKAKGPNIICAALPGENHFLGLHMAATIMALYGFRIIFLGPKTPLKDLQECTWQSSAQAILISISSTTPQKEVTEMLLELRKRLSPNIQLLLGGRGAPFLEGLSTMKSLTELGTWAIQKQRSIPR
jgi:methanogenic corrinoid protein MtbC1